MSIARIPIQVCPAPVPQRITRHELAELRVVVPVPQQVDKARVLIPVPELRSHPVVQILTAAAREPECAHQMRVVRGACRGQRLARVARQIEDVEAVDALVRLTEITSTFVQKMVTLITIK